MNAPQHPAPDPARLRVRPDLVVCDQCDAVHQRTPLGRGQVAHCQRCHALLGRGHVVSLPGLLAFALSALVFLILGNLAPLATLEMRGTTISVSLLQALALTWKIGQPGIALLAGACAIAFPLCMVGLRVYILWPLSQGRLPPHFVRAMHALRWATLWSMVEVFLLSALVAMVRSAGYAAVVPGMGMVTYAALTLLLTSLTAAGLHTLWNLSTQLQAANGAEATPSPAAHPTPGAAT